MDTPVLKTLSTNIFLVAALAVSTSTHAAEKLFDLVQTSQFAANGTAAVGQISFGSTIGSDVGIGNVYDITLPMGNVVLGEVVMNSGAAPARGHGKEFLSQSFDSKVIRLDDSNGTLELHLVGDAIAGVTLNDTGNRKIYRAQLDGNGFGDLVEVDPKSVMCLDHPNLPKEDVAAESIARIPAGLTENVVRNLQSRPDALYTIYIDNWGGVVEGTVWDQRYNNGVPINYTPYSYDDDTTAFSTLDISYIWLAWAEMSEDYADFDVNITTSTSVYENTPVANRSRVIATTTCAWFANCGAGGVAIVGGFDKNSDYRSTAWTFNAPPGAVGMTHSHEAGHMMGLNHDGVGNQEYYGGHGDWGPIMGAPFGQEYVQWSRGEYPGATNTEDDLSILTQILGQRADDVGDSPSSANSLEATTGTNYTITQDGIAPDVDVFAFTLNAPQEIAIEVSSILAVGNESRAANAAFNVSLEDSDGTVVSSITSSDRSPLRPDTNTFSYIDTLDPDTYYLTIDAVSPNLDWTNGFGEYGNGGEYNLVAVIEPGTNIPPEIDSPTPGTTLAGSSATFSWTDNDNNVADFRLDVGSSAGGTDYLDGASLGGSASDYEYTAADIEPVVDPSMTSPTPNTTLAGYTQTFTWDSNATEVAEYWLYAGSEKGTYNYANSGSLSNTTLSYSPTGLPIDGSKVYVTLFWKVAGQDGWQNAQYSYTALVGKGPSFTSPVSGSTLPGVSVNFAWADNDSGATEYWLYLGKEAGGREYYNSGSLGTATTDAVEVAAADGDNTVTYLPTDGSTIYARLWYRAGSTDRWRFVDDTFVAAKSGGPAITTPVPGSPVAGSSVTLNWEAGGAAVTEWWVYVGSGPGQNDIYNSDTLGAALSDTVSMPADGSTAYVTLWFKISGDGNRWRNRSYTYESTPGS